MSAPDQHPVTLGGLLLGRDEIVRRLSVSISPRPVVGVTGPVGSGKSTLAGLVASAVGGIVLSTDRYLPDYSAIPSEQRDAPQHSDLTRLSEDLSALHAQGEASVPVWSFHEHRRMGEERVRTCGPIICEGIFGLHATLVPQLHVRVFTQATSSTRWRRWEAIERSGERGWGVEAARRHFETVAEPTFQQFAAGYRDAADIIVLNDEAGGSATR